ncbi:hypothetical protein CYG49_00340, partial [Candidatus Saccharibacteria bacterium]
FSNVEKRGSLRVTNKAKGLLVAAYVLQFLPIIGGVSLYILWLSGQGSMYLMLSGILLLAAPLITKYGLILPLIIGERFIQAPRQRKIIAKTVDQLRQHKAIKIAIAGSYGKTTFREILFIILSNGKRVRATPGNYNTPLGISRFMKSVSGDEEVLIFEFGEYYPGDIAELCNMVQPDLGVITGINEAHLSRFGTIDRTIDTIFELEDFLQKKPLYKNRDNENVQKRISADDPLAYNQSGVNGWEVKDIALLPMSTSFVLQKEDRHILAETGLLGKHVIGPIVAAVSIAESLGLSDAQIQQGIAAITPYEHRMAPRIVGGATIVDDTYNGNVDGIRAGIEYLKNVQASGRRIYVTPGLVEQGDQTEAIHIEIGRSLAPIADIVVLMQNSVTPFIQSGLQEGQFSGELVLIDNPLDFYKNIDHFVAAGDIVLMQNDWTDNYS